MPISASLFYSGNPVPTNASATPQVYDIAVQNVTIYLPKAAAAAAATAAAAANPDEVGTDGDGSKQKYPKTTFQFIGLDESVMRNVSFEGIKVVGGASHGWYCEHTAGFTYKDVAPMPDKNSGCLN